MLLVDTHCHIHDSEFAKKYDKSQDELVSEASDAGVKKLICVGTDIPSSVEAVKFVDGREGCYCSVALHPHEAANMTQDEIDSAIDELDGLISRSPKRLVAVGECGLDYYYHSDGDVRDRQHYMLRKHIDLAQKYDLPMIFHVREAFDDFFRIIDDFSNVRGVVHSFSATNKELAVCLEHGFYVGLNGIMTFTKDKKQLEAAKNAPSDKILVETDAPFLTPEPFRGTINTPKHVINITKFLSELRGESLAFLAEQTTKNAKQLFKLK